MYILKLVIFYHGYIYRISVCFVFPRTVKVSIRNYTWTIRASVHLEIDHFSIMVIYTGFPYVLYSHVQWRYQYETILAIQDQVSILKLIIVLSWLYIPDFRIFCISMYSEGINTKLHLDYKGKCTSLKLIIFLSWLYIPDFRIFCSSMYCTVKVSIRNYTWT